MLISFIYFNRSCWIFKLLGITQASLNSGLPHTQGTQGIQGNSGNFQVEENLRETQGDSGNLREF